MNVWRLVLREILHRKLNFAMGLLSVAMAVGCFVGAKTLLRADEIRTEESGREKTQACSCQLDTHRTLPCGGSKAV